MCNSFLPKCDEHCRARYPCDYSCNNLKDVCFSFLEPFSLSTLRKGGARRKKIELIFFPQAPDVFDAALDRLTKCNRLPFVKSDTVECSSEDSLFVRQCEPKVEIQAPIHREGKVFPAIQVSLNKLMERA